MPDEETPIACLLVHGLNGGPHDMAELAAALEARGIATDNILLPGHAMHHRQAARFGWSDWVQAARERFDALAQRYSRVAIVGHSMGGALALYLAATDPRVAGLAALCAPIQLYAGLAPMVRAIHKLLPFFPLMSEDIRDPAERRAYRQTKRARFGAMAPVHSLLKALPTLRANLTRVRCPALIVAARNDHVVPARDGRVIFDAIGSSDKQFVVLDRSWHVVTRDLERDLVTARVVEFVERVASAQEASRAIASNAEMEEEPAMVPTGPRSPLEVRWASKLVASIASAPQRCQIWLRRIFSARKSPYTA
jgi:carboxylesterase